MLRNPRVKQAVVTVAVLLLCRGVTMIPVFRDTLERYLGIGDSLFGFLLSLQAGAGLFTVLASGVLVDRWGPRSVLRIALVGVALALGVVAAAGPHWKLLAGAMIIYGMWIMPLGVAVDAYLVKLLPRNRRRVLSLNLAGTSVGDFFFPALAETLLHASQAFAAVTFAMVFHGPFAVLAAAVLISSFFYRGDGPCANTGAATNSHWHWRDMLLPPRSFGLIVLIVLHAIADTTLYLWMPRFLGSEVFSQIVIRPGYVLSGYAIAYAISRLIIGLLPENLGRRALMVAPGVVGGSVVLIGILSRSYTLAAGGYILGAFVWSAEYPSILSILAQQQPERFGTALALLRLLSAGGSFLALNGMGLLISHLDEPTMWKAMVLPACLFPCVSVGAALWLVLFGCTLRPGAHTDSEDIQS